MKSKICILAIVAIGFSFAAEAQTATPKVTKQQMKHHKRIKHGQKEGTITKKEAISLKAQQRHIQRRKRRFKKDGHLTGRERAVLHRKQKRANRNIYRLKHNAITR